MHISFKFISLNPHQPPNSLHPEAVTSCRRTWRPPCPCRPLSMRSWPWGRPGCFKAVYWPLSQLRSTWNNPKDCNLLSWEAKFPGTSGLSAFSQCWVILAVFGVARPQNPLVFVRPKALFCVNFGQECHLPPQYPGFDTKLSLKVKPGTCALL